MSLTSSKNPETQDIKPPATALSSDLPVVSISEALQESREALLRAIGHGGLDFAQYRDHLLQQSDELDHKRDSHVNDLLLATITQQAAVQETKVNTEECDEFMEYLHDQAITIDEVYSELYDRHTPKSLYAHFRDLANSGNQDLGTATTLLDIIDSERLTNTAAPQDIPELVAMLANLKHNKNGDSTKSDQEQYDNRFSTLMHHLDGAQYYEGADKGATQELIELTIEKLNEAGLSDSVEARSRFLNHVLQNAKIDPSEKLLFRKDDDTLSSIISRAAIVSQLKKTVSSQDVSSAAVAKLDGLRDKLIEEYKEYLLTIGQAAPIVASSELDDLRLLSRGNAEEVEAADAVAVSIEGIKARRKKRRADSLPKFSDLPKTSLMVLGGHRVESKPYVVARESVESVLKEFGQDSAAESRLLLLFEELDLGVAPEYYRIKDDPKISFKEKDFEIEGFFVPDHLRGSHIAEQMLEYFIDHVWDKKSDLHTSSIRKPGIAKVLEKFGLRPMGGQLVHVLSRKDDSGVNTVVADKGLSHKEKMILKANQQEMKKADGKNGHVFYKLVDSNELTEAEQNEIKNGTSRLVRLNAAWLLRRRESREG